MDSKSLALKVLDLPSAKVDLFAMNFESVYQLSLDAAVVVMKNVSSASKAENVASLVAVVNEVLDMMKMKVLSSAAPETPMKEIVEKCESLKRLVDDVVPVVFSRLHHLNPSFVQILSVFLSCLSLCKKTSSAEEVVSAAPVVPAAPAVPAPAVPAPVVPAPAVPAPAVPAPVVDKIPSPKGSDVKKL